MLHETDGVITFDAVGYHPEATAAFREWFAETSRRVFFTGPPVVPPTAECVSEEQRHGVLAFLDSQLASHGARCVVYVGNVRFPCLCFCADNAGAAQTSFGSLFWPSDPAKFHAVLSVLIERDIPFVRFEHVNIALELY